MRYQPGQTLLDKYRIEAHIGRGAFADVYHVTHLELNAPRAIKVLHRDEPGLGSTQYQDYQQRFRLEAQLGAKINRLFRNTGS
jgi:serine/threonine protein kinase